MMSDNANADMKKLIDKYVFTEDTINVDGCEKLMKAFITGFMSLFEMEYSLRKFLKKNTNTDEEELEIWIKTMRQILKETSNFDISKILTKKD